MIREYINRLINENNEKLKSLENQLREQISELESAEGYLESLQTEANADQNIFSPRAALNKELKDKAEKTKKQIDKAKQETEYIKTFIETHLIKKQEYEKLLAELDEMSENECNERKMNSFLTDLSAKTESCLSLLYSDRIKCKNELKSMKGMIQTMVDLLNSKEIS